MTESDIFRGNPNPHLMHDALELESPPPPDACDDETAKRNAELIVSQLMLGEAANARPAGTFVSPSFNLNMRLENPSLPGSSATVTVMGVKLNEWNFDLPEDDFAMEQVSFRALWVKVEDTTA